MDYKIKLNHIHQSSNIVRLSQDAQGFVTSLLLNNFKNGDAVFIAKNDVELAAIEKQIKFFAPNLLENFEVLTFPAWDCQPFDRASPKQLILAERMRTLCKLAHRTQNKQNFLFLTTVNAISQKVVAPSVIKNFGLSIKAKSKISIEQIIAFLVFNGYQRNTTACDVGEFAVRGGIIDVVMNRASDIIGYRIDFFGDEIESIKEFDPLSQLSQELVRSIEILPAGEIILNEKTSQHFREQYRKNFVQNLATLDEDQLYSHLSSQRQYEGMEHWLPFFYEQDLVSVFDYLKNPTLFFNNEICFDVSTRWQNVCEHYKSRLDSLKESKISGNIYNPISPQLLYFSDEETNKILAQKTSIIFHFADAHETQNSSGQNSSGQNSARNIDLEITTVPNFALAGRAQSRDPVEIMAEYLKESKNKKILIACLSENSRERVKKLLLEFNLNFETCLLEVNQGFAASDFILVGEQAIFGEKIIRRKTNNKAAHERILEEGLSINLGDLVVHRNHGIGKFDGIHTITLGSANQLSSSANNTSNLSNKNSAPIKTDMLKIIYGGSDVLFVPVEDIDLITRYGADNPLIQLDRLGVAAWKNRKAKVRNRIKVAAEELIKIAAARQLKTAPAFEPDQHLYEEFKARFNFVETEDQLKAIDEIEEDLRKGAPMDRLVCGDVGFGKTEVAMRAAFIVSNHKAAADSLLNAAKQSENEDRNKNSEKPQFEKSQIAIITPTTLLCRQHFHNFTKRFEGTNIKIKQLSRMVTAAESKKIKQELEAGSIDIIIGTHALLNKNIKFKNLSFVIIDEEQHFGVAQKERLKELKNEVHLLTLSATPIPRTLQMSLTGVKDLSLIATPPLDRLAVRNFVMPYDSVIVREAIMREYQRSGKVFFVVPRVSDIREIEDRLQKSIPEVKITHAHGQMAPTELDKIMNDFYDGKIDVLLSTTIIESGIDIASANTIIIYKAEMFGLAQLYQLRGRVGRSKTRGYAYFMLSPKKLNKDSKKKLEVMQHLDDLGVGFTIASHDMDIRGSGDLLGAEQSGHIKETGAELYQQMLVEEIAQMKNKMAQEEKAHKKFAENNKNSENKNENQSEENFDTDFSPQIKLGISLLIPEEYMPDLALRMSFYKKISHIKNTQDQEKLNAEMFDRFGKIPTEIENLIQISLLKHQCKILGVERIETTNEGILISFKDNKFKQPEQLLKMIFSSNGKIKLQQNQKILFTQNIKNNAEEKIATAFATLAKLQF